MKKPKPKAKKPRRVVLGVGRLWHGHTTIGLYSCEHGDDVVLGDRAEDAACGGGKVRLVAEVLK